MIFKYDSSREIVLVTGASGFIGSYVFRTSQKRRTYSQGFDEDKQFTTLSSDELHQRSLGIWLLKV